MSSKYYFFDVGVVSALQGRLVAPGTPEFGPAFETYVLHELLAWRDYVSGETVQHWRSASGLEVDFILGGHTAIEVKASDRVGNHELKPLRALAEETKLARYVCVSLEPRRREVDGVDILPLRSFLDELWSGEYAG